MLRSIRRKLSLRSKCNTRPETTPGRKGVNPSFRSLRHEPLEERALLSVSGTDFRDASDNEFSIQGVTSQAPTAVDLVATSDTGVSATDNITNLDNSGLSKTIQFAVSGTISGASVTVYADNTTIGSAVASGTTTIVTTDGTQDLADGIRTITARQTESGQDESGSSPSLSVTIDTSPPVHIGRPDQITKLLADDGAAIDALGGSVSISGSMAIVGATGDRDHGTSSGSAYIFEDTDSGWIQVAKLTAADSAAYDYFGCSVAISGSTAIVGAYGDDSKCGSAYIFEDTGSGWTQVAKLTNPDRGPDGYVGISVSISGSTAIVGSRACSAFIFRDTGSGWSQVAKLSDTRYDYFGRSVSISGTTAIVGDHGDDDNGSNSGAVYIFEDVGTSWHQGAKLGATDGTEYDAFGRSVFIDGGTVIVGAPGDADDGTESGSSYIFEDTGSGWAQVAKLTADDGAALDYFGSSVSISGSMAIVGAYGNDDDGTYSGSAYLFENTGSGWTQLSRLTGDGAVERDYFGGSVSISDGTAIVGASGDDQNGPDAGAACIFRRTVQLTDDTGANLGDRITSDTTPELTFTFSEAIRGQSSDVTVLNPNGNPVTPDSISGWGTNTLVVTFSTSLNVDGEYTIMLNGTSTIIDSAGNALNGGADETVTFTIDTTPATPTAPDLQADSDRGVSDSDNLTSDNSPTFDVDGSPYYRVYRDGIQISGDYEIGSYTDTSLPDGTYTYTVTAVDAAGRESAQSPPLDVTIFTVAPDVPTAPDLQAGSDTGVSNNDNVTSDTTPSFGLNATPYFRMYRDGIQVSGDYESGSSYTLSAQADGASDYTVTAVDAAGNESAGSAALSVTIDTGSPVQIEEITKLLAGDGAEDDWFGYSVSISGNTAVVGARDTYGSSDPGSAYIFENAGSGWTQVTKLITDDGSAGDVFGFSVSISGTTAIVGAIGDDDNGSSSGSAYVFADTGSGWTQVAKLTASDGAVDDFFGYSVSISGNTAIVGASWDDDIGLCSGSAYIFQNTSSGWTQVSKLTALDAAAYDYFGNTVSISGSTAIVGAYWDDDDGPYSGSAYIFEDTGSGWNQVGKLTASDAAASDYFGNAVSISGNTAIIGAQHDDDNGRESGSAYIFKKTGSGWTEVSKLTAGDGAARDYFGYSVSISDGTAVVGALEDDGNGPSSGSAYLFKESSSGWTQVSKLTAGDGAAYDYFGNSVSISGETAIVGAYWDDDNGWQAGSAYIFGPADQLATQLTDDTGISDEDLLTNDATPELTFTFSEAVYGQETALSVLDPNRNSVAPDSISGWGSNTLTITFSTPLSDDGEYTVVLNDTGAIADAAGNAFNDGASVSITFTLDTAAPAVPSAPDLQAASDSGVSANDNLTKDNSPTFNVSATPYYRVYRDGSQISGDYESGSSYTPVVQADGAYNYAVSAVDAAGNESAQSVALGVTIDTEAATIDLRLGVSSPTPDASPSLTVTATDTLSGLPDGTEVWLDVDLNNDLDFLDAGEKSYTVSSLAGGTTTFDVHPDLAAGTYGLQTRVTDVAGNEATSDRKELTIGVSLEGTNSSDTIAIWPGTPGGTFHRVSINGKATDYDPAVVSVVFIDALGGQDRITVYGTDQDESATLAPGSVDVVGETYEIHGVNVETIEVNAGTGDDEVGMTGSTASNRFYSYPDYARLADSARSYSFRANGFDSVAVETPGSGRNYAYLYDSPGNDLLDAKPTGVTLQRMVDTGDATTTTVTGCQRVYAYASGNGGDEATLTGSELARNRFYGYADYGILTESRRSFYFYARGFDAVTANSPSDGYTYAYLYDSSGADELKASPTSATMDRATGWSDTTANGFKRVYAHSTRGGDDTAQLTGSDSGGNHYRGTPTYSTLTDKARSFYYYTRGFHSVVAIGSETAGAGDRAYLYDSRGADTLVGRDNSALLRDTAGTAYQIEARYFDRVYARSTDGRANDTVDVDDSLVYELIRTGKW